MKRRSLPLVSILSFLVGIAAAAGTFVAPGVAQAQCEYPRLLLVVDKSSSMITGTVGGTSKWVLAQNAIQSVTTDYDDSIDFGLQTFPMPSRCEPGAVVLDIGRNTSTQVMTALGSAPPTGGSYTPLAETLAVSRTYAPLLDSSYDRVLVLITDGWQWCDPYDASTRFNVVNEVAQLTSQGVRVYVVGFGDSVDPVALNRAAVAAGTAQAGCDPDNTSATSGNNCYIVALSGTELETALSDIARETATEICDDRDNDCDGVTDEGFDADGDGVTTCDDPLDCNDMSDMVSPLLDESCNGTDDNCDGVTDEGCGCTPGDTRSCGDGVGLCDPGNQVCSTSGTWGRCDDAVLPAAETCDGYDEDCDSWVDEEATCPQGQYCDRATCVDYDATDPDPPVDPRTDQDEDGIPDAVECPGGVEIDSDEDGIPDCQDPDDDNDGILTINERPSFMDQDTDGDLAPNHLDPDDDNDGILTIDERPGDLDLDSDEDGAPNHLDRDDDGDGIPTDEERPGGVDQDTDEDTRPNHLDPDDDDDSVLTINERPGVMDIDTDADGTPDHLDTDDDGDGILTIDESADDGTADDDFDDDGTPSYRDLDSDGDGLLDADEGRVDANRNGEPDYLDVGTIVSGPTGGGCSCRTSGGGEGASLLLVIGLIGLGLGRRRHR